VRPEDEKGEDEEMGEKKQEDMEEKKEEEEMGEGKRVAAEEAELQRQLKAVEGRLRRMERTLRQMKPWDWDELKVGGWAMRSVMGEGKGPGADAARRPRVWKTVGCETARRKQSVTRSPPAA
jgi:hypothetical protein